MEGKKRKKPPEEPEEVRLVERKGPGKMAKVHYTTELEHIRNEIATEVFLEMAREIIWTKGRFPRRMSDCRRVE